MHPTLKGLWQSHNKCTNLMSRDCNFHVKRKEHSNFHGKAQLNMGKLMGFNIL